MYHFGVNVMEQIRHFFADRNGILLVVLYGSFASGAAGAGSDVDLGVAYDTPLSAEQKSEWAGDLSIILQREVDLVDLRRAHGLFLKKILTGGKVIIKNDATYYAELIKQMLFEMADFWPYQERMMRERRETWIGK